MKKSRNIFLKCIINLFGLLFMAFILVCLVSLFKFLYFPSKPTAVPKDVPVDKFSKTIDQPMGAEHFHILDKIVYSDSEKAPMCLQCHGNFCHNESKELRSFYNMHTFYLACETCHVRQKEGEQLVFKWFDDKSGQEIKTPVGSLGSYGAKIVPTKGGARLDEFPKEALAIQYMDNEKTYSDDEKKKIQQELMEHISEEAVTCKDCHKKEGYVNFGTLGYARERINRLVRLEIIQLIDEYKEFYLPTLFDPDKAGRTGEE